MNTIDKELERHEIEVLLPWYAAGTLSRCDADLVERALARDSELARRYDLVRQELAETIELNEALGAPSAHQPNSIAGDGLHLVRPSERDQSAS
jgi:anti-sigma-K factor RskA